MLVFTPDDAAPSSWHGAKVVPVSGFPLPFYPSDTLRLSPGIDAGLWSSLEAFKPDVLHVSSPGLMVFAGIALANFLALPLVISYHTHVPQYIPKYAWEGIVEPSQSMMWSVIRMCSEAANLTLVTSTAMQRELQQEGCKRVVVWQRGVDTESFHPRFWSEEMRRKMIMRGMEHLPDGGEAGTRRMMKMQSTLSTEKQKQTIATETSTTSTNLDGDSRQHNSTTIASPVTITEPDVMNPIIGYVGRLGSEKNVKALRQIVSMLPTDVRQRTTLVLVGDGPARAELEEYFGGGEGDLGATLDFRTVFTGMLHGEELSKAYASIDVFVMPSETETLGFVVLEALASGVPVVAVASGGLLDIIDESKGGGFFYQPGDYTSAASIVTRILKMDASQRQAVSEAARQEVMPWGWQAATERLRTETYTRAIRRTRVKRIMRRLVMRLAPSYILARIRDVIVWLISFAKMKRTIPTVAASIAVLISFAAILALKTALKTIAT